MTSAARSPISEFLSVFRQGVEENGFVSLSLDHYAGQEAELKRVYARKVLIKREEKLSFTYRYKTRDIVKNYSLEQSAVLLETLLAESFRAATLHTVQSDLRIQVHADGRMTLTKSAPSQTQTLPLAHDRVKKRLIGAADKPYLRELGVTDAEGNVLKGARDKYRQMNKYVEILGGLLARLPQGRGHNVIDMGCGKGYLTFALYDYMTHSLGMKPSIKGVDARADMVELCNKVARNCGFEGLRFEQGAIESHDSGGVDILIALHACDTATDAAISQGIKAGAELIVVAPCCHKQVRAQMEAQKASGELGFLLRHGILAERQGEMVTDAMRALVLEYFGYATKVFEFISDAHTPKNVMIVAVKSHPTESTKAKALESLRAAKSFFGIEYHALERMTALKT